MKFMVAFKTLDSGQVRRELKTRGEWMGYI